MKPFIIGEKLILNAMDISCELLEETTAQKGAYVPLLASIVTRQIDETVEGIEAQLLERINASLWYTTQVGKSTSVDKKANVLLFVWYISQEDVHIHFQENMLSWALCCQITSQL